MPTLASSARASSRELRARRAPDAEHAAGVREQRELHVLDAPSARRRSRRSGTCGRRPGARSPPASGRPARRRRACTEPASGASWPPTMLKQVVLPAPFGPISASISPAARSKLTSSTARMPPNAFDSRAPRAALARRRRGRGARAHDGTASRRKSRFSPPATPSGNDQHQRQHDDAEQRAPVVGLARDRVLQPGEERAADPRPRDRLHAAEQHHHEAVDRLADAERLGRDRALRECEQRAGEAGDACRRRRRRATAGAARRCRSRRRAAASRGWRAAPGRSARAACARAGRSRRRCRRAPAGSTPTSAPATATARCRPGRCCRRSRASHWKTTDQTICANASVSIAR